MIYWPCNFLCYIIQEWTQMLLEEGLNPLNLLLVKENTLTHKLSYVSLPPYEFQKKQSCFHNTYIGNTNNKTQNRLHKKMFFSGRVRPLFGRIWRHDPPAPRAGPALRRAPRPEAGAPPRAGSGARWRHTRCAVQPGRKIFGRIEGRLKKYLSCRLVAPQGFTRYTIL